jgi:hypothetical protein
MEKEFEPLAMPEKKGKTKRIDREASFVITTRMCVDMPENLVEKIKDYAYWEGYNQQEILLHAVTQFFSNKTIKSRPEIVKNRPKLGRKPKS